MTDSTNSNCSICCEKFTKNDPAHKLNGCSHSFHAGCIITWFRTGHSTCPMCRATNPVYLTPITRTERYNCLRRSYRRKDAPHLLKKHIKTLINEEKRENDLKRQLKEFHKKHKALFAERLRMNSQLCKVRRKIQVQKAVIGSTRYEGMTLPIANFLSIDDFREDAESDEDTELHPYTLVDVSQDPLTVGDLSNDSFREVFRTEI